MVKKVRFFWGDNSNQKKMYDIDGGKLAHLSSTIFDIGSLGNSINAAENVYFVFYFEPIGYNIHILCFYRLPLSEFADRGLLPGGLFPRGGREGPQGQQGARLPSTIKGTYKEIIVKLRFET